VSALHPDEATPAILAEIDQMEAWATNTYSELLAEQVAFYRSQPEVPGTTMCSTHHIVTYLDGLPRDALNALVLVALARMATAAASMGHGDG
jgi:hypothetical protein